MSNPPAEPGCEDCPSSRLCDTLRSLTARDMSCPTVNDLLEIADANGRDWRLLLAGEE